MATKQSLSSRLVVLLFAIFTSSLFILLSSSFSLAQGGPPQEALSAKQTADNYAQQGDINKAIESYEQAIRIHPQYSEVYYALGFAYDRELGNPEKAVPCYERFLELAPKSPDAEVVRYLLDSARQSLATTKAAASPAATPAAANNNNNDNNTTAAATNNTTAAATNNTITAAANDTITDNKIESGAPIPKDSPSRVKTASLSREVVDKEGQELKKEPKEELNGLITRSIKDRVLKYALKLEVWDREGYIKKFNELALARGSPLTNNVAEKRAQLRQERQKSTDFINYSQEAEDFLVRQMVKAILKENYRINLSDLPRKVDFKKAVPPSSRKILDLREDKKYINLSMEAKVDIQEVKQQLAQLGYQFTPLKIQLSCSNLYGELSDKLIEAICRKSEYLNSQADEGLYEIYTSIEKFKDELNNMTIGQYDIEVESVVQNKVTITALEPTALEP